MIEWQSPAAFLLFIPLALLIVYNFTRRRDLTPSLRFSSLSALRGVDVGIRARLAWLVPFFKYLAMACVIVALARPQMASTKVKRNIEGVDIMIALDVSDSMLIEDMLPENRLESSKRTISDFIKGRTSDRLGLVVFSGESYTRVPLTLDYPLLLDNLSKVKTSRNIKMGTAIGVALANSVARLTESTAKSRIVIFLTDGENNSGTIDPETALKIAKDEGIKIYSIGMGKDGQAQLPVMVTGPGGQLIKQYRPIHSTINEPLLRKFADETGGKFWRATTTKGLEDVFSEIDRLEKTKIEESKFTRYTELYQGYVRWALVFMVMSLVLGNTVLRRRP